MTRAAWVYVHIWSYLTLSIVNIDHQRSVWSYLNYVCVCLIIIIIIINQSSGHKLMDNWCQYLLNVCNALMHRSNDPIASIWREDFQFFFFNNQVKHNHVSSHIQTLTWMLPLHSGKLLKVNQTLWSQLRLYTQKIKQMSCSASDTRHTDYRETERGLAVPNKSTNYPPKNDTSFKLQISDWLSI